MTEQLMDKFRKDPKNNTRHPFVVGLVEKGLDKRTAFFYYFLVHYANALHASMRRVLKLEDDKGVRQVLHWCQYTFGALLSEFSAGLPYRYQNVPPFYRRNKTDYWYISSDRLLESLLCSDASCALKSAAEATQRYTAEGRNLVINFSKDLSIFGKWKPRSITSHSFSPAKWDHLIASILYFFYTGSWIEEDKTKYSEDDDPIVGCYSYSISPLIESLGTMLPEKHLSMGKTGAFSLPYSEADGELAAENAFRNLLGIRGVEDISDKFPHLDKGDWMGIANFKILFAASMYAMNFPDQMVPMDPDDLGVKFMIEETDAIKRSRDSSGSSNLGPITPHWRRMHWRRLENDRYKRNEDGSVKTILVSPTWVGGGEHKLAKPIEGVNIKAFK
jgi:hypothetical protein